MGSSREKKETSTKRALTQVSRERDKRARINIGPGLELVEGQAALAFFGDGLISFKHKEN